MQVEKLLEKKETSRTSWDNEMYCIYVKQTKQIKLGRESGTAKKYSYRKWDRDLTRQRKWNND